MPLVQTQETCYFYSVLNTLAETKWGRRLLLVKMNEFLSKLSEAQREIFFNRHVCIKYSDLPSVKRFIFFKFIYNYWKGYRELKGSVKLFKNLGIKFIQTGYTAPTRNSIFNAIGIHKEIWFSGQEYKPSTKTECVVKLAAYDERVNYGLPTSRIENFMPGDSDFVVDSATINITNNKDAHVIAAVRLPDNTFELQDSSDGKRYKCDWLNPKDVERVWKNHYSGIFTRWVYTSITYIKTKGLPEFSLGGVNPSPTSKKSPNVKRLSPAPHGRNSLGRKIMKGPKGGLYVMVGATKKYGAKPSLKKTSPPSKKSPSLTSKKLSPAPHGRNSQGRKIIKGPRGGLYVMVGAVKKYGAKPTTK
jgi:hypothetical protein